MAVNDVSALDSGQLETLIEGASQQRTCVRVELVGGRPWLRTGLAAGLLVAALSACATSTDRDQPRDFTVHPGEPGEGGLIAGTVLDYDGQPVADAVVVLQGSGGIYERWTGRHGGYAFDDLPPDRYVVHVVKGAANTSKILDLPAEGQARVDFRINPEKVELLGMLMEAPTVDVSSASSSMRIYMDRAPER